jgi:hypothetical protein
MFFHKKAPHHPGCLAYHIIVAIFLFLASVVSFVGVIMAHYSPVEGTLIFGTPAASLAIIAFAVCITFLTKSCKSCMSSCDACAMPAPAKKK